jgi:hypothetical protein
MFTIYQLANTIIYDLPKLIIQHLQRQQPQQQNFEPKVIVISDLLDMFVNDLHVKVEEAKNLLKEIMVSILRTREILGNYRGERPLLFKVKSPNEIYHS